MNWQHLKYFAVVAQEEHFTKAAEKLFISQSTLSKAVDTLEKETGIPLFVRQGRNVKLTSYGKILRDSVLPAMQLIDSAVLQINEMINQEDDAIRVSSIFTMGADYIPKMINAYSERYRKVQILFTQQATKGILQDVSEGKIDVGFCGEFVHTEQLVGIERVLAKKEPLVVVVPKDSPFATAVTVKMSDLLDEVFIGWNDNTGIALSIKNALTNAGYKDTLKCNYSATEDNTVAGMVRNNLGIGIIADVDSIDISGLRKLKISDIEIYRNIYMVWNKNRHQSSLIRSFVAFVKEHAVEDK